MQSHQMMFCTAGDMIEISANGDMSVIVYFGVVTQILDAS
jgi:hypothetical protein